MICHSTGTVILHLHISVEAFWKCPGGPLTETSGERTLRQPHRTSPASLAHGADRTMHSNAAGILRAACGIAQHVDQHC
jgi:hypothetical protein